MIMNTCKWFQKIEAFVDGETSDALTIEAHLAACPTCSAHRKTLLQWRAALRPEAAGLSDQQFPAFMEGIRAGLPDAEPHYRGFWALTSLAAAALVIALATFSILSGPDPVLRANEVESATTEIEGASVGWKNSGGGVTTIWISIAEDDV